MIISIECTDNEIGSPWIVKHEDMEASRAFIKKFHLLFDPVEKLNSRRMKLERNKAF